MTNNVENAFLFNVLMPDVLLFSVAISAVFCLMLVIF